MSIKYNIHKNILGGIESICINTVIDGVFHGIPIASDNHSQENIFLKILGTCFILFLFSHLNSEKLRSHFTKIFNREKGNGRKS